VEYLTFHTEELPQLAGAGARYVVVACCGTWRDGEVTGDAKMIPALQRTLRKRFMNRLRHPPRRERRRIETASFRTTRDGGLERI
jgi:hypothetical protein